MDVLRERAVAREGEVDLRPVPLVDLEVRDMPHDNARDTHVVALLQHGDVGEDRGVLGPVLAGTTTDRGGQDRAQQAGHHDEHGELDERTEQASAEEGLESGAHLKATSVPRSAGAPIAPIQPGMSWASRAVATP